MDFSTLLTAEMIAACGAFFASVLSGAIALVAELRRPLPPPADTIGDAGATPDPVLAALAEECDHLSRTMWLIEKRLSDEIRRIEVSTRDGGA